MNIACRSALQGQRILITRPPEQAAAWIAYFQSLGANTYHCPLIAIQPELTSSALNSALEGLESYSYLVVSSTNTVHLLLQALQAKQIDPRIALAHLRLVAVGPQTSAALANATELAVVHPEVYQAENLVQMLIEMGIQGQNLLYLRAQGAREVLATQLRAAGARVDEVVLYQTQAPDPASLWPLLNWLEKAELDILTFASASAVAHFADAVPQALWHSVSGRLKIAALGPITAQAVQAKLGQTAIVPAQASLESLAEALQIALQTTQAVPPEEAKT